MSIKDQKVAINQGVGALILPLFHGPQIPISQTDFEAASVRLPSITDWYIVSAYVWARALAATPEINIQDDGTDLGTNTVIAVGAQTVITGVAGSIVAGGSELQVVVTTDGSETVDDLLVTLHLEPLYLYGRAATPTPS